jgi:hypothetical protein
MVRKTTAPKAEKSATPKKSAPKKTATKPAPKASAPQPSAPRASAPRPSAPKLSPAQAQGAVFHLQVGNTFSLLTEQVDGGAVLVSEPVRADARLQVTYWKEPRQLALSDSQFVAVKLHARVDGGDEQVRELGRVDDFGRFVRATGTLALPAGAQRVEYWFEISTSSDETLWDSDWGNNYWLAVTTPEPGQP